MEILNVAQWKINQYLKTPQFRLHYNINDENGLSIAFAERLSDRVYFDLGDIVMHINGETDTIKSFEYDCIYLYMGNNTFWEINDVVNLVIGQIDSNDYLR